jgi:dTDP-4-amino-4,6-dideoxygalactose transaminase
MKDVRMRARSQVIGGVFDLADPSRIDATAPAFITDNSLLLVNARSGIWLLTQLLSPGQVWLPSYLCGAILEAFDQRTTCVRFYGIDDQLIIPSLDWVGDVERNDLVVLIDYFGFPCDSRCIAALRERGAWVLEDACQALLSSHDQQLADFILFSPRKFLGIPDGGILNIRPGCQLPPITLTEPPTEWWLKALSANLLRRTFDDGAAQRRWLELFQESETESPCGGYAMSQLSRMLLKHSFDYEAMARQRIENYRWLAERLGGFALFPRLVSGVVPLGFPVRLKNRDSVRQTLFTHEIYPPIHWRIEGWVDQGFAASHQLAAEIMTLPCDQRYGLDTMEQMASIILQAAE